MKKHLLLIALSALFLLSSCSEDDKTVDTPVNEAPINLTASEIASAISDNGMSTWKISNAEVRISGETSLDVTQLYNVQDDEFYFQGNNDRLQLRWNKGYHINVEGNSLQEMKSDKTKESEPFDFTIDAENSQLSSSASNFSMDYNHETSRLTATISFPNTSNTLELELKRKLAQDYVQIIQDPTNPVALFSFETRVPRIGINYSHFKNSLYVSNRNDLTEQGDQAIFKFDFDRNSLSTETFNTPDFASKEIVFTDDRIFSIGGSTFESFGYDLENMQSEFIGHDKSIFGMGAASIEDRVYIFGGSIALSLSQIVTWDPGDLNYTNVGSLPLPIENVDGEIVNNILYTFGGEFINSDNPTSDKFYAINLQNQQQTEGILPRPLSSSYASRVQHLIYVGGEGPVDTDNDGTYDATVPFLGAFDTNSQTIEVLNIASIIPNEERIINLRVASENAFLATRKPNPSGNNFIVTIYQLNISG